MYAFIGLMIARLKLYITDETNSFLLLPPVASESGTQVNHSKEPKII